jgi:hypothetical protein
LDRLDSSDIGWVLAARQLLEALGHAREIRHPQRFSSCFE